MIRTNDAANDLLDDAGARRACTETGLVALQELVEADQDTELDDENVRMVAVAELPTEFGEFAIVAFANNTDGKEHVALIRGDVVGASDVPVRLHSECLTGDVLGSLRCDCRSQLLRALEMIGSMERGILLYMRQEGRGIGLVNKVRAYALQDEGLDTVDANRALGFRDDEREYSVAARMLTKLGVESIRLVTNNPDKIRQLRAFGVDVAGRIPHIIPPTRHNRFYLETKSRRSGHLIDWAKSVVGGNAASGASGVNGRSVNGHGANGHSHAK